jgi:NifU-like protein
MNKHNEEHDVPPNDTDAPKDNLLLNEDEGETICYCFDVPDTVIRRVIRENRAREVDEVTEICNAGGGCTSCHPDIEEMIDEFWSEQE